MTQKSFKNPYFQLWVHNLCLPNLQKYFAVKEIKNPFFALLQVKVNQSVKKSSTDKMIIWMTQKVSKIPAVPERQYLANRLTLFITGEGRLSPPISTGPPIFFIFRQNWIIQIHFQKSQTKVNLCVCQICIKDFATDESPTIFCSFKSQTQFSLS